MIETKQNPIMSTTWLTSFNNFRCSDHLTKWYCCLICKIILLLNMYPYYVIWTCIFKCKYFIWGRPSRVRTVYINSSPPGQNDHYFADDIFICIFVKQRWCILIEVSVKLVLNGPIDNNPALVKIRAWRRIGNKSLSEPMLTGFIDANMGGEFRNTRAT